jgi:protein-S-isoprenylcysteine O-methyltransferase Ste14
MLLRTQMQVHGNTLFKYRGELPIILIPPGLFLLYYQITSSPEFKWEEFLGWYKFVCLAVVGLGQFIRAYALAHVAPNTSGRNINGQIADVVNNTGLYSIVRHPLYVGNFFMALGVAMLSCNAWFVLVYVLAFWIYYERIIFAEEHFISQKFDAALEAWANQTPTFFPALGSFRKPSTPFNWRKIIRQEKNGVLATFSIFLLYTLVQNWALYGKVFLGFEFWTIAFILSIAYYLTVRTISKKSSLLESY